MSMVPSTRAGVFGENGKTLYASRSHPIPAPKVQALTPSRTKASKESLLESVVGAPIATHLVERDSNVVVMKGVAGLGLNGVTKPGGCRTKVSDSHI